MKSNADTAFLADFEARLVLDGASAGGVLGVAVSGGADSMALLVALLHRVGARRLRVITVNHSLRPAGETDGDAAFVAEFCAHTGVPCTVVTLERGDVHRTAEIRARGTEEAARFLRYQAFDRFIAQQGLCALCLAHNQNDQLETLAMRFLQGSAANGGIAYRRGSIIRPLLNIPRSDIERYLRIQDISWRTDATNADTRFLRNAIRHRLLPLLDEAFDGWQSAVLAGAEKASDDNDALDSIAALIPWERGRDDADDQSLSMRTAVFYGEPVAVRRRLFFRALTELGYEGRFPYAQARQVLRWNAASEAHLCADGVTCAIKNARLFIKKTQNRATETGFLGILEQVGDAFSAAHHRYEAASGGVLLVDGGAVCTVRLPACVRSVQSGDSIADAGGGRRSLSSILSGWHVASDARMNAAVVQELATEGQPLVAVLADSKQWIVRSAQI